MFEAIKGSIVIAWYIFEDSHWKAFDITHV